MIQLDCVTKRYGRFTAVDSLTLSIADGESVALWGSNGAGKTTLIRCVLGVTRFRGSARIRGLDVLARGKAARSLVGYVPQELAFHDDARVGHALMFFAGLRRVEPTAAARALDSVGLTGNENKRLRDLSGGMKQRLALAVALLSDPPIIVLDEPTSNLDAAGRAEVVEALTRQRVRGKTLLFASHRPEEVHALAGRVIVMEKGRLARDTTPDDLWPRHGVGRLLRLIVTPGDEHAAAETLRRAGHTVSLNGHGLCVAVRDGRKAAPIEALIRADVSVRDIDLLDESNRHEDQP